MQNNNHGRVLARITDRPEKIGELRSVLPQLREETRKENDWVSDQLFQNKANPSDFTVAEEWANDLAIDSHMATTKAFAKATPLLATTPKLKDIPLLDSVRRVRMVNSV
jgi:quinol monooxygenase YgiN